MCPKKDLTAQKNISHWSPPAYIGPLNVIAQHWQMNQQSAQAIDIYIIQYKQIRKQLSRQETQKVLPTTDPYQFFPL